MASNSFGEIFRITTWGESHGKAVGVVIDGCPPKLPLDVSMIDRALERRAPGRTPYTSPRSEPDRAEILSGVFEGFTTGTPISILIWNKDPDPSKYEPIKHLLRPGHANYGYLQKYGIFDHRGGGRASARETACRVAAGAVAQQLLTLYDIQILAFVNQVGNHRATKLPTEFAALKQQTEESPVFCPDPTVSVAIQNAILDAKESGDSLGGSVSFRINGVPSGIGDPLYSKLDARLGSAMLSIPATKGIEIGSGFHAISMTGSEHNDSFAMENGMVATTTNKAGGILGGISTGMCIEGNVAFKPTSSIRKTQQSLDTQGNPVVFTLPEGSRHDPCVVIRAPAIVEAMASLVVADALLMQQATLPHHKIETPVER